MSINEKALANVTILKYNNAQSLNDFKAGHVDVLDIIVNLIFHLQNRHYFPLCAVVVRLLRIVIRNCITVESNYKLADVARSSKIKFNFTFDFDIPFLSFPKISIIRSKEMFKEQL